MLPVKGAREEVGWRGSSRSSRLAVKLVSFEFFEVGGSENCIPSSGSIKSSSSTWGGL